LIYGRREERRASHHLCSCPSVRPSVFLSVLWRSAVVQLTDMRADPDKHEDLETDHSRQSPGRCSPNNTTPLLTASLNAPPQSYYAGLNGNVRVSCATDLTNKTKNTEDSQYSDSTSQGLSSHSSSSSNQQAVFYSTLLKQLRQKAGDNGGSYQQYVVPIKIKKEKGGKKPSRSPLPFVCPACKKRFQRKIAMNSHFQNEHISEASATGERSCKLCGSSAASMAAVRSHLLTSHNIDLDNNSPSPSPSPKYSLLEASLRSGSSHEESEPSCSNIDMSSSRSNTPTSTEPPTKCPEQEDDTSLVEDLSLRRPAPSSPTTKRQRVTESPPPGGVQGRFCCSFCNISYPDQTLHFLHMGFHSELNPWKCSRCGHQATCCHDFNTHLYIGHQ